MSTELFLVSEKRNPINNHSRFLFLRDYHNNDTYLIQKKNPFLYFTTRQNDHRAVKRGEKKNRKRKIIKSEKEAKVSENKTQKTFRI